MHIGVYTSGGDAPGMNAAIRAVVRTSYNMDIKISGITAGYNGMLNSWFQELSPRSCANIIQRGGTMLKTARCMEFLKPEMRELAAKNLKNAGIDALVCIGGDGSYNGALALHLEQGIPVIGVPGTIDNDIYGTDFTVGFDSAVNTALDAIDKIRDTATSHDRIFIVEVMGRNSGFLALDVGIAGGAQDIFVPEKALAVDKVIQNIQNSISKGKLSSIIVAAEGQKPGRAYDLAEQIRKKSGLDAKVCVLGHIQRGGAPTARDRVLASAFGAAAVEGLSREFNHHAVGLVNSSLIYTPLDQVAKNKKNVREDLLLLAHVLAM
ncbi:MAG: 6-phosphofructokinase [Bdellovibrionales bacterium]